MATDLKATVQAASTYHSLTTRVHRRPWHVGESDGGWASVTDIHVVEDQIGTRSIGVEVCCLSIALGGRTAGIHRITELQNKLAVAVHIKLQRLRFAIAQRNIGVCIGQIERTAQGCRGAAIGSRLRRRTGTDIKVFGKDIDQRFADQLLTTVITPQAQIGAVHGQLGQVKIKNVLASAANTEVKAHAEISTTAWIA